jgi:hypothetical protein
MEETRNSYKILVGKPIGKVFNWTTKKEMGG